MSIGRKCRFRLVDKNRQYLNKLSALLPGSKIVQTQAKKRYVNLHLADEKQNEVSALLDIDEWVSIKNVKLPEIPWDEVPLIYLAHWLTDSKVEFFLGEKGWLVKGSELPEHVPNKILQLDTTPCRLLVSDWYIQGKRKIAGWINDVPFELRYVLGHSVISLSEVVNITSGDILIISNQSFMIVYRNRALYSFEYNENSGVTVDKKIFDVQNEVVSDEEKFFEWSELPVKIEFVLDKVMLKLSDLDKISQGDILPLNKNAENNIQVYINNKLLAIGELVELEQNVLAVELKEINKKAN
ncbi:TPA: hypothetical protein J1413_004629 [Escherichia coli]|nr:hypothetical protein [Escherichia coli]HBA9522821.1 hypothetical protein [Escherichia coli]HBA9550939.1 hypothetical protein [Escherichia coli]HBA9560255.1 hypothetical protein [Escherichia coli]